MLQRFASRYLWFSPFAILPLAALYHGVTFWAGVAGGVVHLALIVVGMRANGAFKHREDAPAFLLGVILLITGGAEVWATGASGPPDPAHLNVAFFNQAGLTLGFFITLLGFAAMVPVLVSPRGRSLASVGFSCFFVMFVIWALESALGSALRIAMARSPLAGLTPEQWPEPFLILRNLGRALFPAVAVGGYLGGAILSEVSIDSGWVGRRAGRLMSIYCVIGIVAFPLGQFVLPRVSSVSEVPWFAWMLFPFLPPAMMCLVPYYVGVQGLRHAAKASHNLTNVGTMQAGS
jgi:hypothetical protein